MKKPDLTAVKQFLFDKGEKIGLVVCTGVMVVVVGWSLYKGFTATGNETGKPWAEAINEAAKGIKTKINSVTPNESELPKPPSASSDWNVVYSSFQFASMFPLPDKAFTKKLNPRVFGLYGMDEDKNFHLQVVRAGYLGNEIDPATKKVWTIGEGKGGGGKKGGAMQPPNMNMLGKGAPGGQGGGASNLSQVVRPVRMVVVAGIFPMREQLEEYRKALRFASIDELLLHRDLLPKPLGLEVSRCEILPGGKATPWQPLFKYDAKTDKTTIAPRIRDMMRHMVVDDEEPQTVANYVFPGLVTPLPKLANASYAKLDLKGFDVKNKEMVAANGNDPKLPPGMKNIGAQPKIKLNLPERKPAGGNNEPAGNDGGAAALADVVLRQEAWKNIAPELRDKFEEKYFMFDPLGTPPGEDGKAAPKGASVQGGPRMAPPNLGGQGGAQGGENAAGFGNPWDRILGGAGGGQGAAAPGENGAANPEGGKEPEAAVQLTDALVRFFDPDVQPGKTYCYTIRVRMANPNFNRKNDVAFAALADQKELDHSQTPNFGWTITPTVTIPGDYFFYAADQKPEKNVKGGSDFGNPPRPDMTAIQVQRWLDKINTDSGGDITVADWAIAERLWVRRGDPIGRNSVMIEVPEWKRNKQAFDIGHLPLAAVKVKGKVAPGTLVESGLPIDFVTQPPHLVVDFEGGKRDGVRIGPAYINDISSFDVLVLTPDGKLVMRNSRVDSDPETPAGFERSQRVELWKQRLQKIRGGPG